MIAAIGQVRDSFSCPLTMIGYENGMSQGSKTQRTFVVFSTIVRLLLATLVLLVAMPANAQAVFTYTNATDGTISATTPCNNPLIRNFTVSDVFTVADVDLGVFVTHSWRGDNRITLQHPDGTRVQLVDGDPNNTSGDNFNVLLDDAAGQAVNTDSATGAHSTAAPPPFANTFSPNAALSAFNGKASNGTWRMEICDIFTGADDGTFRHAELYLTSLPADFADLSLTKAVSDTGPDFGDTINYTLSLTNSGASTQSATPEVTDLLPVGVAYVSHSGPGSYDDVTGLWLPGVVAIGQTVQLTITVTVQVGAGAPITNSAEVTASDQLDSDSIPDNQATGEDDYDDVTFTVAGTRVAGTPPTLTCPDGFLTFDWAGRNWPQGSTANNYTLTGLGAFNWSITSPAGFMNIPSLGGQHPVLTTAAQSQTTLSKAIDFNNRDEFALTEITLGEAVDGAQLVIFDVDFATNDFADRVEVYGELNGVTVIPVLTNGLSNYVIGNVAYGDQPSASSSANGNVTVTFNSPVDTIFVAYGNHSTAPNDPDGQAIQMQGGITICEPDADLFVLKSSKVIDDNVGGGALSKAIPSALIQYCILLTNSGTSAARNITASDTLPSEITFQPGTIRSGINCDSAATFEDDDDAGGDESDPAGASFIAGVLSYNIDAVDGGSSAAVTFEALIN